MRYPLLLIISLSICLTTTGQKISFTDTTNEWFVLYSTYSTSVGIYNSSKSLFKYYYDGKKQIDGKSYQVLTTYNLHTKQNSIVYYIRKDSITKNIYMKVTDTSTLEYLLYNNEYKLSDTFPSQFSRVFQDANGQVITQNGRISGFYIKSIDSIIINNVYHKRIFAYDSFYYENFVIVEGIGAKGHPIFRHIVDPGFAKSGITVSLVSFKNKNICIQSKEFGLDCEDTILSKYLDSSSINGRKNGATNPMEVYPQPAINSLEIGLPNEINGEIVLYNQFGQLIHKQAINSQRKISIQKPSSGAGLYHYKILDSERNKIHRGKLMFH